MIQRGWALSEQGAGGKGLEQMREGMGAFNATGAKLAHPYHLALLAQAYGKSGQPQEGLALLDQALAAVDKTGERYYEAELHRLKGELTLQSPVSSPKSQVADAEKCFWKAIEIACKQQAKSLELRATVSLARLWQRQGKKDEAR
jgi:predicted ATPase